MPQTYAFDEIGRFPAPGDNVAIATRRLEAGAQVAYKEIRLTLDHTVMEGHRFAVRAIAPGEALLSWGMPFGAAVRAIAPGAYICNAQMLDALRLRDIDFDLPSEPNFEDRIVPYHLDGETFRPGRQVPLSPAPPTFMGYRRPSSRGVGTRNHIVILGTTSRTASYAQNLAERLNGLSERYGNIDGIVAVAHTEGGGAGRPNNLHLVLPALAGFMVHPNVGAVLAVDYGTEPLTNRILQGYLEEKGYPLKDIPHRFLTLSGRFRADLEQGEAIVKGWLDAVDGTPRTEESAANLKLVLQCGGSDAFSGISGNPLVGWVAREVVRYGGSANLAETTELIGAESYILQNARDLDTARRFLSMIARYKERAAWHGATAEGNPSGGNKFRGLYNIVLKSLGAAAKRHPDVRLDDAIDYATPMRRPGFYFMDSPGNDPESIAGQVASGGNMIFFITGNGSVTNFPFVPTLKVITTTRRFELLSDDMDVNAGAYLDGTPMDVLGQQMLDLTLKTASGALSKGERAAHSQISLWRDWQQTDAGDLERLRALPLPGGESLPIRAERTDPALRFTGIRTGGGHVTDRVGLILPGSLCSAQVARLAAERLNRKRLGREKGLSRFAGLMHTEGCGVSGGYNERLYVRTAIGYLTHPLVEYALVLEHGCEKTHNDHFRHELEALGISPQAFGWASVQLDGGIERVLRKIEDWFASRIADDNVPVYEEAGLAALRVGLLDAGPISETASESLAVLTRMLVGAGGTVVVPGNTGLLAPSAYRDGTLGDCPATPTLACGARAETAGFHIMENPTDHGVETLTGLGATGVEILLVCSPERPLQGHPMIPTIQVAEGDAEHAAWCEDIDRFLGAHPTRNAEELLHLILKVASREYTPRSTALGNTDFQVTRGLLGLSL